ncbi:Large proline-rich protein bag6, partial [Dissophora ornata]
MTDSSASQSSSPITLTVKTIESQTHSVTTSLNETVLQLKERLAEMLQVPTPRQRLIFRGRVLVDDKQLSEYSIHYTAIHRFVDRRTNLPSAIFIRPPTPSALQDGQTIHLVTRPVDAPPSTQPSTDAPRAGAGSAFGNGPPRLDGRDYLFSIIGVDDQMHPQNLMQALIGALPMGMEFGPPTVITIDGNPSHLATIEAELTRAATQLRNVQTILAHPADQPDAVELEPLDAPELEAMDEDVDGDSIDLVRMGSILTQLSETNRSMATHLQALSDHYNQALLDPTERLHVQRVSLRTARAMYRLASVQNTVFPMLANATFVGTTPGAISYRFQPAPTGFFGLSPLASEAAAVAAATTSAESVAAAARAVHGAANQLDQLFGTMPSRRRERPEDFSAGVEDRAASRRRLNDQHAQMADMQSRLRQELEQLITAGLPGTSAAIPSAPAFAFGSLSGAPSSTAARTQTGASIISPIPFAIPPVNGTPLSSFTQTQPGTSSIAPPIFTYTPISGAPSSTSNRTQHPAHIPARQTMTRSPPSHTRRPQASGSAADTSSTASSPSPSSPSMPHSSSNNSSSSNTSSAYNLGRIGVFISAILRMVDQPREDGSPRTLADVICNDPETPSTPLQDLVRNIAESVTVRETRSIAEGRPAPLRNMHPILNSFIRNRALNGQQLTENNLDSVAVMFAHGIMNAVHVEEILDTLSPPAVIEISAADIRRISLDVLREHFRRLIYLVVAAPIGRENNWTTFARDMILWIRDVVGAWRVAFYGLFQERDQAEAQRIATHVVGSAIHANGRRWVELSNRATNTLVNVLCANIVPRRRGEEQAGGL